VGAWPRSTPSGTSKRWRTAATDTAGIRRPTAGVCTSKEIRNPKGRIVAEGISTLTDATFDESIGSANTPLIVDFWAEWCGPCKMIAPVLEEIAKEQGGKVSVAKLNVDDNPEVARRFEVMSIPTLLVFADGEVKRRLVGAKGKAQLLEELSEFIA
jgi:thioredoxin 1